MIINFEVPNKHTERFCEVLEGFGCKITSKTVDPGGDGMDYIVVDGYPTIADLSEADIKEYGIKAF